MGKEHTYNPYGNNPTGLFLDRFQGVMNDGAGSNLAPSLVDYAQDAEDRWRGAVKKRVGSEKYLSKGYPLNSFSNIFEGYYMQGDDEVWYRTDSLLDYRRVPGSGGDAEDPPENPPPEYPDPPAGEGTGGTASDDTFTGDSPTGGYDYPSDATDAWRYRHISLSIRQRLLLTDPLVAPPAEIDLPTEVPDASITYVHLNNARSYCEYLSTKFIDPATGIPWAHYYDVILACAIGGWNGTNQEWSNNNSTGTIVYRNRLIASDIKIDLMYAELEIFIKKLRSWWTEDYSIRAISANPNDGSRVYINQVATSTLRYPNEYVSWTHAVPIKLYVQSGKLVSFRIADGSYPIELSSTGFGGYPGAAVRMTAYAGGSFIAYQIGDDNASPGRPGTPYNMYAYYLELKVFSEDAKLGRKSR